MSQIGCKDCSERDCRGCNVYTLYEMLEQGKLSRLMNGNHLIVNVEVQPLIHSTWVYNDGDNIPYCDNCGMPQDIECDFCPSCGADMRGK